MKTLHVVAVCTAFTVSAAAFADFAPVDYVLPEMGTDSTGDFSTGNTYPAIARPWGMNFWSPVTTERNGDGWMYGWRDNKFRGIRQTHQLSPWVNDYGSFLVMPVVGKVAFTNKDRGTRFTHKAETFKPYHYGVYLGEYDVKFEVTPTERAAMMRVTYPETDAAYLVIDAGPGRCGVRMEGASRAVGWNAKNHGSVGKGFRNTFALEFSEPVVEAKAWLRESLVDGDCVECEGREKGTCGLLLKFAPKKRGDVVTVRVASTFLGEDQLARNFRELGARSFDEIAAEGRKAWNDVLGRMKVESEDFNRKQVFYTCLYRAALWPHKLYEMDGRGRPVHANFNGGEPGPKPGCLYGDTVFWDTFRALFPLMNFFAPEQAGEATEGWECVWKEAGWLPEGMSPGLFACMIGNNSASIVADACISGVPGRYDKMELFRAMVHGAENSHIIHTIGRGGAKDYIACGYLPYDNEQKVGDSAARTLEYAYDDWCVWNFGRFLGLPESEYARFGERAKSWRNVYDASVGWMRGRAKDGTWRENFDKYRWGGDFTEGNPIHWSWSVFHDVAGLIEAMGGRKAFNEKLEWVMTSAPVVHPGSYGGMIHEMREMQCMPLGQYAHGNQPIQHMLYLWNWSGEPWRSQYWVREAMDLLYQPRADGFCGDDDTGQTSAWFVWGALGFYPVCPGTGEYVIGSPIFDRVTVEQPGGRRLVVEAKGASRERRYIDKVTFDGRPVDVNYLRLADLRKGGRLVFTMSDRPNTTRGTSPAAAPYSMSAKR